MIVSFDEALEVYNKIPEQYKSLYYHPEYIEASARETSSLKSIYFVREENKQFFYHAALIGEVAFDDLKDLQTPYGYGGPIIIGETDFKECVVNEYKSCCKQLNILIEFIRFHPVVGNYMNYYGEILENRSTVVIDLKKEDLFKSFSPRVKTAIKSAEKKKVQVIVSKQEQYINSFFLIYTQLMIEKQTAEEYLFSEDYIKCLLENEKIYLLNAIDEEGNILGASIFMIDGLIADYHLSATTQKGKLYNVNHLLIYQFAQLAKRKQAHFFYLGGGTNSDSNNSLLFFKKGFSKNEYTFFIGYNIFNQTKYNEFKRYYCKDKHNNRRILFYR